MSPEFAANGISCQGKVLLFPSMSSLTEFENLLCAYQELVTQCQAQAHEIGRLKQMNSTLVFLYNCKNEDGSVDLPPVIDDVIRTRTNAGTQTDQSSGAEQPSSSTRRYLRSPFSRVPPIACSQASDSEAE